MPKKLLAAAYLLVAASAQAGPMGFEDSWMFMGDFSANWRESFLNYAVTPRDAFGAGATYMRSDDHTKQHDLVEMNYTRLLHRWNMPEAQANAWFQGGIGNLSGNDFGGSKLMYSPGIQLDYETTRVYFAAVGRLYRAPNINHDFASIRAGFSFYESSFYETQPWLILEARYMNDLSDKVEITPMLRLINQNYFVEAGINNANQLRFNLMYVF